MRILIKQSISNLNEEEKNVVLQIEQPDSKKIYAKKPKLFWWLFCGLLALIFLIGIIAGISGASKNISQAEFGLFIFVTSLSLILFLIFYRLFYRAFQVYFHPKNFYIAKTESETIERLGNRITILPQTNIKEVKNRAIFHPKTMNTVYSIVIIYYSKNSEDIQEYRISNLYNNQKETLNLLQK